MAKICFEVRHDSGALCYVKLWPRRDGGIARRFSFRSETGMSPDDIQAWSADFKGWADGLGKAKPDAPMWPATWTCLRSWVETEDGRSF